jgi:hypothetical protein
MAGSARLNIRDRVDAWAFDLAVTHRLYSYDAERWKYHRKAQTIDVLRGYAGKDLNWEEE